MRRATGIWIASSVAGSSVASNAHNLVRRVHTRALHAEPPPLVWLEERIARLQERLDRRTAQSALLLRKLLGEIRLEPVTPEVGRPYYRAKTNLDVLALVENEPDSGGPESGSTALRWWRRRESNPRPKARRRRNLHACPLLLVRARRERAAETARR